MNSLEFIYDGEKVTAEFQNNGSTIQIVTGNRTFDFVKQTENIFSCNIENRKSVLAVVQNNGTYYIDFDSIQLEVKDPSEDGFAGGAGDQSGEKDKIFAPMPGKIVKVMVEVGDEVEVKQQMVIVEAMKMENVVVSKAKGKVKTVNFSSGDQVDTETPIIELELEEE